MKKKTFNILCLLSIGISVSFIDAMDQKRKITTRADNLWYPEARCNLKNAENVKQRNLSPLKGYIKKYESGQSNQLCLRENCSSFKCNESNKTKKRSRTEKHESNNTKKRRCTEKKETPAQVWDRLNKKFAEVDAFVLKEIVESPASKSKNQKRSPLPSFTTKESLPKSNDQSFNDQSFDDQSLTLGTRSRHSDGGSLTRLKTKYDNGSRVLDRSYVTFALKQFSEGTVDYQFKKQVDQYKSKYGK